MNTGPLDRRIELQSQVSTQDSTYGTKKISWITTAQLWANVQDQMPSRNEGVVNGAKEVALNRVRVRIRWKADITTGNRFKLGSRLLKIIGGPAEIGGRRAFMEFMCEEVKP